jgi:hypothetical protein
MNPENRSGDHAEYKAYTPPAPKPSKVKTYALPIGLFLTAFGVVMVGTAVVVDNARENRDVGKSGSVVGTALAETPEDRLTAWFASIETKYDKFADDLDTASNSTDLPVYQCQVLKDDVTEIMKTPIPDDFALVSNNWNRAMNSYYRAFDACLEGDYLSMGLNMAQGNENMNAATEALPNG